MKSLIFLLFAVGLSFSSHAQESRKIVCGGHWVGVDVELVSDQLANVLIDGDGTEYRSFVALPIESSIEDEVTYYSLLLTDDKGGEIVLSFDADGQWEMQAKLDSDSDFVQEIPNCYDI